MRKTTQKILTTTWIALTVLAVIFGMIVDAPEAIKIMIERGPKWVAHPDTIWALSVIIVGSIATWLTWRSNSKQPRLGSPEMFPEISAEIYLCESLLAMLHRFIDSRQKKIFRKNQVTELHLKSLQKSLDSELVLAKTLLTPSKYKKIEEFNSNASEDAFIKSQKIFNYLAALVLKHTTSVVINRSNRDKEDESEKST